MQTLAVCLQCVPHTFKVKMEVTDNVDHGHGLIVKDLKVC